MTGVKPFSVLLAAIAAALALLLAPDILQAPTLSPPWLARHLHADTGHLAACRHSLSTPPDTPVSCPAQVDPINLGADWVDLATDVNLRNISYHRLAGAIRIPTESYDDMSDDAEDPIFDAFYRLEEYLRATFPRFHATMTFERVNVHALLFTWSGSDPSLKPMVLMAHQDVVPVDPSTVHLWTHPPYSAQLDDEGWIWGRGTTDMKGTLVSILSATEKLLEERFQPHRTVLFSFGFDEEVGGARGAKPLSELLYRRYGRDGVAFVFDEGFTGVDEDFGCTFARVGIAEKGCLTLELSVHTSGGHSSAPPTHTGIGIMSRLLVELENNPFLPAIDERNPLLTYLECAAQHGDMDDEMKAQVRQTQCWPLLADTLNQDKAYMPFLRTTQAVDMVRGGIKFNALPESVHAVINYRIGFFESSQSVINRVQSVLQPIIASFNLSLSVLDSEPFSNTNAVRLKTYGILIEPAPISPTEGAAFGLMAGTIKHVFPGAIVVPSAMTAFTDTQYYWSLSRNIYRFVPASLTHIKNYHTVDERLHLDAHLSVTRFYYKLLQNAQGLQD